MTDAYFLFAYPFLLVGAGLQRARSAVAGRRARPQSGDAEVHQRTDRGARHGVPARALDARLRVDQQPQSELHDRRPQRGNSRAVLPRRGARAVEGLPAVSGVTFRVHGESGVEEGSYEFWKTVFDGVATCGRTVEIDMHAKGMDQTHDRHGGGDRTAGEDFAQVLGRALRACRTTRPTSASWSGPSRGARPRGLMKFSAGSRSFLRYGYGDLLREDRKWGVLHRIWPGTQRLLFGAIR